MNVQLLKNQKRIPNFSQYYTVVGNWRIYGFDFQSYYWNQLLHGFISDIDFQIIVFHMIIVLRTLVKLAGSLCDCFGLIKADAYDFSGHLGVTSR